MGHAYCEDCASLFWMNDALNSLNERVKEIEYQLKEAARPDPDG